MYCKCKWCWRTSVVSDVWGQWDNYMLWKLHLDWGSFYNYSLRTSFYLLKSQYFYMFFWATKKVSPAQTWLAILSWKICMEKYLPILSSSVTSSLPVNWKLMFWEIPLYFFLFIPSANSLLGNPTITALGKQYKMAVCRSMVKICVPW